MDFGNTYATSSGERVMLYATLDFNVPLSITLKRDGDAVEFKLIPRDVLRCGDEYGVKGSCTNQDCHRSPLRECKCGRHEFLPSQGFVRRAQRGDGVVKR